MFRLNGAAILSIRLWLSRRQEVEKNVSVYKATGELPKVSYTYEDHKEGIKVEATHITKIASRSGEEKIARDDTQTSIAEQSLIKGETNNWRKLPQHLTVVKGTMVDRDPDSKNGDDCNPVCNISDTEVSTP